MLVWALSNPSFAAPDELLHYLRAIGVGQGQLIGEPSSSATSVPVAEEADQRRREWTAQSTRLVRAPADSFSPFLACNAQHSELSASCLDSIEPNHVAATEASLVGNYQPLPYLAPALGVHLGSSPVTADRWGRLAAALPCTALLALAVAFVWSATPLSLIGLTVAVTPMVLFIGSSLNPSGLEIAASIAFFSGLLRIARSAPRPSWVIWGTASSGVLLVLSRSPGPVELVIALGAVLALVPGLRATLSAALLLPLLVVAVAVALNVSWEISYGSRLPVDARAVAAELPAAIERLPAGVVKQEVGVFGTLDTSMPLAAYVVWLVVLAALVAVAAVVANRRERAVLVLAVLGALLLAALFDALFLTATTFAAQGRHLLPIAVIVPLLAGEILVRRRHRLPRAAIAHAPVAVASTLAVVQFVAWYTNARRQSVGTDGALWFLPAPEWSPPLGWWPWLALAVISSLAFAGSGLDGRRR